MDELTTKVTTINSQYHCRLIRTKDGSVANEMACKLKEDIHYCIRYMLRMYGKCGGTSSMADASRYRYKGPGRQDYEPKGKIWYPSQIPIKRR